MDNKDLGRPGGLSSQATEPVPVSALRASIPDAGLLRSLRLQNVINDDGHGCVTTMVRNPDGAQAASLIEALWWAMRGGNADHDNAMLMEWIADRLVNVHGENPRVDYILALRTRAAMIRSAAQAIEARRAETGTGSVEDESAVGETDAPKGEQS